MIPDVDGRGTCKNSFQHHQCNHFDSSPHVWLDAGQLPDGYYVYIVMEPGHRNVSVEDGTDYNLSVFESWEDRRFVAEGLFQPTSSKTCSLRIDDE